MGIWSWHGTSATAPVTMTTCMSAADVFEEVLGALYSHEFVWCDKWRLVLYCTWNLAVSFLSSLFSNFDLEPTI